MPPPSPAADPAVPPPSPEPPIVRLSPDSLHNVLGRLPLPDAVACRPVCRLFCYVLASLPPSSPPRPPPPKIWRRRQSGRHPPHLRPLAPSLDLNPPHLPPLPLLLPRHRLPFPPLPLGRRCRQLSKILHCLQPLDRIIPSLAAARLGLVAPWHHRSRRPRRVVLVMTKLAALAYNTSHGHWLKFSLNLLSMPQRCTGCEERGVLEERRIGREEEGKKRKKEEEKTNKIINKINVGCHVGDTSDFNGQI